MCVKDEPELVLNILCLTNFVTFVCQVSSFCAWSCGI